MLEIYSSNTNLDSTDAQSYFSDEPDDSSFMMSGSLDELNLLTQCVTTSLQHFLTSSDQMDSGTASGITPRPHTSTSSMTAHTPTKAVVADLSAQLNSNIKEAANNTITDESTDEGTSNVYPITSGIYNIIQRWKGANGSQRRSMATPGSNLVQIRIMPYQQAKTMDPTQRYKCTKKYAQVVLNPLQHTPQIRLLRQLFREMEKVTDTGSGLESNMPLSGPPSVGKTWFANIVGKLMINTGYIGNSNRFSQFPFQDCPRRNLQIFDEPNVEPMALENFKLLFAGTPTPANIKYESQNLINRTPVIVTCNRDPFPKTPEFQTRIRRFYWAHRIDNNIKQLTAEIHPLGLFQLLTNTSTANVPPHTDDDIIEYDFGSDYAYMHANLEEDHTQTATDVINNFNLDLL
uniref:SF3 helicase domain-containing protein n=1 Tax=Rhodnius prolixus TaxID=13249 RepID=T1I3J1_RHOPR